MRNANILFYMSKIFDPCVGDAIANFLILESLFTNNSLDQMMDLYKEMPTRMLSVKIKSKSIFKMKSDIEIIEPEDLKNEIKKLCVKFGGRSFVRPSGTEDLVRIFAEAEKKEDCDRLCINVAQAVYNICEGIVCHPEIKY
ncbi:Phosphoglucomutase-3 [Gurleya vavrai]